MEGIALCVLLLAACLGDHFDLLDRQVNPLQLCAELLDRLMETLDIHLDSIGR